MSTVAASAAAHLPLHQQLSHFQKVVSSSATLIKVLERAASFNLPNWYLAGGAISQTIWNHSAGFPPDTGIRDYDLVYFDPSDTSYEAEDLVIQASKRLFADLAIDVEVRNQARVHLWFEQKYGVACPPYSSVEAAIDTWISTSAMVGVRLEKTGEWSVYAPRGLSDDFSMIVRPNLATIGKREIYEKKVNRWKAVWSMLVVEPWPLSDTTKGEA